MARVLLSFIDPRIRMFTPLRICWLQPTSRGYLLAHGDVRPQRLCECGCEVSGVHFFHLHRISPGLLFYLCMARHRTGIWSEKDQLHFAKENGALSQGWAFISRTQINGVSFPRDDWLHDSFIKKEILHPKRRLPLSMCCDMKCVCVHSVAQSCLTLGDPMDCSLPGSSVHGILQARILECVAICYSRGSSQPRDWTHISCVSCMGRQILYHWCHLGSPWHEMNLIRYFPLWFRQLPRVIFANLIEKTTLELLPTRTYSSLKSLSE